MDKKLILYVKKNDFNCNCVLLYLAIKKVAFEKVIVDFSKNEHKTKEFQKMTLGRGNAPILKIIKNNKSDSEESKCINGSSHILDFLETVMMKEKSFKTEILNDKLIEYHLNWKNEIENFLKPSISHLLHSYKRKSNVVAIMYERVISELHKFNEFLAGKKYISGKKAFGLLDIQFGPLLNFLVASGVSLKRYRFFKLDQYLDNLKKTVKEFKEICKDDSEYDFSKIQEDCINNGMNRNILPASFVPEKYTLTIIPNHDDFTFKGEVKIELKNQKEVNEIRLNAKELTIKSCSFFDKVTKETQQPYLTVNDSLIEKEEIIFYFLNNVKNDGILTIKYKGIINDKMDGYYRSKYKDPKTGKQKYMSTTQCEPIGCRRILPCVDEPGVKSKFEVSLIVNENMNALSNMDLKKKEETIIKTKDGREEKKIAFHFNESPIMSSYLLAFCVFDKEDYSFVEGKTQSGLPIRVWAKNKEEGRFALETSIKSLPLFEEYFDEKFPLPKLDLIAIAEFSAGAMENWGLITFRETAILIDENSSAGIKQRVAVVVIHEISHSWFGNLVTMDWWNGLWLNEGFASWCQHHFTDLVYPEMHSVDQFITQGFLNALSLDSLETSHAVEVDVFEGSQIDEIFDSISYSKGCCVIRMIIEHLGLDVFKQGIVNYIKEFKYKNTKTTDLWDHLSKVSKLNVKEIMESWTKQVGYPLITVKKLESSKGIKLELTQNRYFSSGAKDEKSIWNIPLSYFTNQTEDVKKLIFKDKKMILSIDSDNFDWIKFNPELTGLYRVYYQDSSLLSGITKAIKAGKLSEIDRFSIQNDYVDLSKSGIVSITSCMDLISSYSQETSYIVLNGLIVSLSKIYGILKFDEAYKSKFNDFVCSIFNRFASKFPLSKEEKLNHIEKLKKRLIVSSLLSHGHKELSVKAIEIFENKKATIEPDLIGAIYSAVVKKKGKEGFDQVRDIFESSNTPEEKVMCLRALGDSNDTEIVEMALEYGFGEKVKDQDRYYLLGSIAGNPKGRNLLWEYFKKNQESIVQRFKGNFLLPFIVKIVCIYFNTSEMHKQVKEHFHTNPVDKALLSVNQALESIKVKSQWFERIKKPILEWLSKH